MKYLIIGFLIFISPNLCMGGEGKKTIVATKTNEVISIDGDLDEEKWLTAPVAQQFFQLEPDPGGDPTFPTEVRVLYDDEALYVGAILYDDQPELIFRELNVRDSRGGNTDWFSVTIDTYQDGSNAFDFIVTAAGVQQDIKLSVQGRDRNWDAVWESEVKITDRGWQVEMKIPFAAIRFPNTPNQSWNIQFGREIRRFRERSFWNEIDPQQDGFMTQSGEIRGLKNIESPIRLIFTPYITTYLNNTYDPLANDNKSVTGTAYTAGMDVKYGLNDAFTLDMTLIPDFGQTVSDNKVLNLSPFEVRFEENRAFFTEGTELFNKGGLFYSRRVGGTPIHYNDAARSLKEGEEIINNPINTSLYNASKISGRTSGGLGIGFFNAVGAEEYATIRQEDGTTRKFQTNPLTNYNVVVLDQNLPNNSFISFVNTNVMRSGSDYDANVTGISFEGKDQKQVYSVSGRMNVSQKYFTDETDLGYTYRLQLEKVSGIWQGYVRYHVESPTYDANDLGFVFSPNERSIRAELNYNQFKPTGNLLRYQFEINTNYRRLVRPNRFSDYSINLRAFAVTKSRIGFGMSVRLEPITTRDFFEPRTVDFSRHFNAPANFRIRPFVSTDYRKPVALDMNFSYRGYSTEGRKDMGIEIRPRVRFNDKFSLFMSTEVNINSLQPGYVSKNKYNGDIDGVKEDDILFGERDRKVMENSVSGRYIFNNNMAFTFRVRHYWDKVEYQSFAQLSENGDLNYVDFDGNNDNNESIYNQNFNIFNIDMNYTWRFAPGSDIIVVYKNEIVGNNDEYDEGYFENLSNIFNNFQQNSLSFKLVYFLDYARLSQKA